MCVERNCEGMNECTQFNEGYLEHCSLFQLYYTKGLEVVSCSNYTIPKDYTWGSLLF